MKIPLIACVLFTLAGCSTAVLNPNDVASPTAVATANTTMTVAKFLGGIQTLDCTTPAAAPVCDAASPTDTNGVVQAKTTACLTSIIGAAVYTVVQRQLCARIGISPPISAPLAPVSGPGTK
jgi:hypothetical protein